MFDTYVPDHNRYLKGIISQIREEGLSDELIHSLFVELKFASMLSANYRGAPIYLKRNGRFYMLLFSELDDLMDHFPHWSHSHFPVKWFVEISRYPLYFYVEEGSPDIHHGEDFIVSQGVLLCFGEDDEFIIEGDLLKGLEEYLKIDLCSTEELTDLFENSDNTRLEDLLSQNPKDWDEIIPEIGRSTIFCLFNLKKDINDEERELIYNCFMSDPFGFNREISVSTASSIGNQYAVIINFKKAVDHVLKFGLTGLKVYTAYGSEYMSRDLLIEKYELIEKHCDDVRLNQSHECLFKV